MGGRVGDSSGVPWASLFDPIANARAVAEIQAQALRAAGDLVERVTGRVDGTSTPPVASPTAGGGDDAPSGGDAAALIETWIGLLQRASEAFGQAFNADRNEGARVEIDLGADSQTNLLLLEVDDSGGVMSGSRELWLHNGTTTAIGPLQFHTGELRSADGEILAATVAYDPHSVESLPARSSRGIGVSIEKDGELASGTYRGLIQIAGAQQVWLTIEVVVRDAGRTS
jgi:hypothetical protein